MGRYREIQESTVATPTELAPASPLAAAARVLESSDTCAA